MEQSDVSLVKAVRLVRISETEAGQELPDFVAREEPLEIRVR